MVLHVALQRVQMSRASSASVVAGNVSISVGTEDTHLALLLTCTTPLAGPAPAPPIPAPTNLAQVAAT